MNDGVNVLKQQPAPTILLWITCPEGRIMKTITLEQLLESVPEI